MLARFQKIDESDSVMKNTEIKKALTKGNFVRALALSGYTLATAYYRKNGRQECDLVVRSEAGYEGRFACAADAWKTINP